MTDPPPFARRAHADDLPALLGLRHAVFCVEQGVPQHLERDTHDAAAVHLVVDDGGKVVATCRLVIAPDAVRLGRMAVARQRRGERLGALLLAHAHEVALGEGARQVELHAQLAVRGFYERAGYVAEGEIFDEAGIAHIAMRTTLAPHPA